ncbi:DnaA ATPase domain-containing protein [Succinivibrio dextrinosolvens]|uniref:DnaA ATPase domain-containing protein n=1 Tax=Succinivibrio dextrinosolvens TaxID=83771 RepID=UPI0004E1E3B8|nr:DnaA/Hda family protein [Succinivibrio dextrinosolvens]
MNYVQVWKKTIQECKQSISDPLKQASLDLIEQQASIQIIGAALCFICNNDFIKNLIFDFVPSLYFEIIRQLDNNKLGIKLLLLDEYKFTQKNSHKNPRKCVDNINPEKTFENYLVDPNNEHIYELAQKIAQNPGAKDYNPFFLYGRSGIGKTHLLWAIANRIRVNRPELSVMYIRGEAFIRLFVEYITKSEIQKTPLSIEDFTSNIDVLIIDDIQSISKGEKSIETFIEIISNYIELPKKQLFVASTEFSRHFMKLASKRSSVLDSAVFEALYPPSASTLMTITRCKCKELDIQLDQSVVEYIANNVSSNVRYIEGAIKTLKPHIEINGKLITQDDAHSLLSKIIDRGKNLTA